MGLLSAVLAAAVYAEDPQSAVAPERLAPGGPAPAATNQSLALEESSSDRAAFEAAPTGEAASEGSGGGPGGAIETDGTQPMPAAGDGKENTAAENGYRFRRPGDHGGLQREPGGQTQRAAQAPWYRRGLTPLLLVLAVIGGLYAACRRWRPGAAVGEDGVLQVVARAALSPRHSAALLQVGRGRYVLLGLASDRVIPLSEISDPEEVAGLTMRLTGRAPAGATGFDALLSLEDREFEEAELTVVDGHGRGAGAVAASRDPVGGLLRKLTVLSRKWSD